MNTITISKREISREGVVVLPLKEYERLKAQAVPTYYLTGKKATALDRLVKQGLKEYKAGKCKTIGSLSELD
jgi:hypothetical protein